MTHIVIEGALTTVGPLSIAMPEVEEYGGFPVMSRGVGEDGTPRKTGYLPATTLRGFLRRAVVTRDMKKAKDAGKPYTLQRAYSELIGQDSESEKQAGEIDLLKIREAREKSPVIDLFGSGLGVASRLRVGHFLPRKNVAPEPYPGVRKDLGDTDGVLDLLGDADAAGYLGRSDANSRRAAAESVAKSLAGKIRAAGRKGEKTEELEAELAEARKLVEKHKQEMGAMQVSSRTLAAGYWALPAGLDLIGRIVVMDARDRDLDMIEYGLDRLSRSPVLGAQSARGCGEIEGVFKVRVEGEEKKRVKIGGYAPSTVDVF